MARLTPLLLCLLTAPLLACQDESASRASRGDPAALLCGEFVVTRDDWLGYRLGIVDVLNANLGRTKARTPQELEEIRDRELAPGRPLARLVVETPSRATFFQPTNYLGGPKPTTWRFERREDDTWWVATAELDGEVFPVEITPRWIEIRGLYASDDSPGLKLRLWRVGEFSR